jgi:hypothetical protein
VLVGFALGSFFFFSVVGVSVCGLLTKGEKQKRGGCVRRRASRVD